jgi:hypothetical protein
MTLEVSPARSSRSVSPSARRLVGAVYRRSLHPALRATIRRSRRGPQSGQATVVSIVVVVDAVDAATKATLDSVIRQTYENLQIVVVGPAAAAADVNRYRRWDARIEFLRAVDDETLGGRRNLGAVKATGAQLGFVDGGEILSPKAVATLNHSLMVTSSDFASGRRFLAPSTGGKPTPEWPPRSPVSAPRVGATVREASGVLADHGVSGKLFVRSFFDDVVAPFPDDQPLADSLPITRAYVSGRFDVVAARVCTRPRWMQLEAIGAGSTAAEALERAVFAGADAETYRRWSRQQPAV